MSCKLCSNSLSASCGRQVEADIRKVLEDNLLSEVVESLNEEDEVCWECFSCFEELLGHYAELLKVQEAIKKVTLLLKTRLTAAASSTTHYYGTTTRSRGSGADPLITPTAHTCGTKINAATSSESLDENSSMNTKNQSLLQSTTSSVTRNKKRKVEVDCELPVEIEMKQEPEDSDDMVEFSTDFCDMDRSSSADEEVADVKEEPETEISDIDSMILDDTTQFILDQMLSSDSDSDSDFELNKRKSPKAGKKNQMSKSLPAGEASNNKISRRPKQGLSHASTLKESECELCEPKKIFPSIVSLSKHYEMDHRETERVFMCERFGCDEKLLTYELLEIHKRSHYNIEWRAMTGAPMYHRAYCNVCQLSSHFPAELRNHELEKHLDLLKYACSTCGAKYFSKDILDAHMLVHSDSLEQLECPLCPNEWKFKFPDAESFESHITRMHRFPLDYTRKGLFKKYQVRKSSRGVPSTCKICGKTFTNRKQHKCCERNDHRCELCPTTSKTKGELICHTILKHENPKKTPEFKLTCHKCGKQFATTLMYKRHLNCHNLEMKFEHYCSVCEIRFAKESLFSTHKAARHEFTTDAVRRRIRLFICEVCGKSCTNNPQLRRHERKEHPHIFTSVCTKCDASFSKAEFLETHLRTHEPEGPYVCSLCPKMSHSTGQELETHLREVHTVGPSRTCSTCGEKFMSKTALDRHLFSKHGIPLPIGCSSCSQRFICQKDLRNHTIKTHGTEEMKKKKAEESRRQCEICKKWFLSKNGLVWHIAQVHKNAEVLVCEICGKSITTAGSMKHHMKSHREEKNFACEFCDKRFVRKDALRMHTYTHTGEKPLACYICDKRFNQHTPLKKHIEMHKKDGSWFPKPSASVGDESSNSNNFL